MEGKTDLQRVVAAVKTLYTLSLDEENKAIIKANDNKGLLKRIYNSSVEGIQEVVAGVIREIEGKKNHNSKSCGMSALSFFYLKNILNRLWH